MPRQSAEEGPGPRTRNTDENLTSGRARGQYLLKGGRGSVESRDPFRALAVTLRPMESAGKEEGETQETEQESRQEGKVEG